MGATFVGISTKQFAELQKRVSGRGQARRPSPAFELPSLITPESTRHQLVLGIDPSLRGTGFGLVKLAKPRSSAVRFGVISCPANWEASRCMARISQVLRELVQKNKPTVCVVEGVFYAQNIQTAIMMGSARGAALAAVAEAGLPIYEMAARKVKQAIVGFGGAQKLAVARMVQRQLQLKETPGPDESDALALALAFGQAQGQFGLSQPKRI